jgi:hypothetical protein
MTDTNAGQDQFKWERKEWQRLTGELNTQARGIADRLLAQGPEAVRRLGPQMQRYREMKQELERLSHRVAGTHSTSPRSPDWDPK